MAIIFSDGFESDDASAWDGTTNTGTTLSYIEDPVHCGDHAMQVSGIGGSGEYGYAYVGVGGSEYYARNYYMFKDALPTASGNVWMLSPGFWQSLPVSGVAFPIYDFANSKFGIRYYGTGGYANVFESGTTAVSADTWYCIELYLLHDNSGALTVWVDGVQKATVSADTNTRSLGYVYAGFPYNYNIEGGADRTVVVDCAVVADAYIGPEAAGGVGIPVVMHHRRMMGVSCLPFSSRFPKWKPNITI